MGAMNLVKTQPFGSIEKAGHPGLLPELIFGFPFNRYSHPNSIEAQAVA